MWASGLSSQPEIRARFNLSSQPEIRARFKVEACAAAAPNHSSLRCSTSEMCRNALLGHRPRDVHGSGHEIVVTVVPPAARQDVLIVDRPSDVVLRCCRGGRRIDPLRLAALQAFNESLSWSPYLLSDPVLNIS